MLTGKQKSFLRSQAHELQPVVQIGKHIVTETVVDTTLKALEARELIKVSVLQNCLAAPKEVAVVLAQHAEAEVVQVIGRVIVLYKKSAKPANRIITNQIPK
ncbi:MAG: ribosome assembly RNA-binding protein YhbY [Turicibacter sp.]|nr:ribosome assembly RNA-binding protein YhbY [Turicibacter sp.]